MKRLLCLLCIFLLPLTALSEGPALIDKHPVHLSLEPEKIASYIPLSDMLLVNYHALHREEAVEMLEAIAPDGSSLWSVQLYAYAPERYAKKRVITLEENTVVCWLYDEISTGERNLCRTTRIALDGQVLSAGLDQWIDQEEVTTVRFAGDFQVSQYFGFYEEPLTPTVITYLPGNHSAQCELPGIGYFHALGKQLLYLTNDSHCWIFDETGTAIAEHIPVSLGCDFPITGYSTVQDETLYLFVKTSPGGADRHVYAVYPVDKSMAIGERLCAFSLGTIETENFLTDYGKSLVSPVACGEGFLLLANHPWQWGVTMQRELYYLSHSGELTLLDVFPQDDTVLLAADEGGDCIHLLRREDNGIWSFTYAWQE